MIFFCLDQIFFSSTGLQRIFFFPLYLRCTTNYFFPSNFTLRFIVETLLKIICFLSLESDYFFLSLRVRFFFPQIILKLKAFIIKITVYHIDERTATLLVTHNESLKCLQEIHMKTHLLHATFCHFLISQHCYFCAILSCYLEFLSIFTTRKT